MKCQLKVSVDEVFPHQEEKARVATQCMQTWQATGTSGFTCHGGGVFSHGKRKLKKGKLEPETPCGHRAPG